MAANNRTPLVAPIRLRHLGWLVIIAAIYAGYEHYGTPHLRFRYVWSGPEEFPTYHRCEYVGARRFTIVPADGRCPLILFAKEDGR